MPTDTKEPRKRLKFLERPETPHKGYERTPRMIGMLANTARFGLVTVKQLALLDGGSLDVMSRRAMDLYHHKLLDRPGKQRHGYRVGENPATVYAITRAGYNIVKEETTLRLPRRDFAKKTSVKPATIEHTLDTTDVVIAFMHDAKRLSLKMFDYYDLFPSFPEATHTKVNPYQLDFDKSQTEAEHLVSVKPDRLLAVQDAAARSNFTLETDRGTETVGLKDPLKAKYGRKLAGYWYAFTIDRHTELWGFENFRKLTVTTSDVRIDNMREASRAIVGKDTNLFLWTTFDRLFNSQPLTSPIWKTTSGEMIALWGA